MFYLRLYDHNEETLATHPITDSQKAAIEADMDNGFTFESITGFDFDHFINLDGGSYDFVC